MKYKISNGDSLLIKKIIKKYTDVIKVVENTKDKELINTYLRNEEINFGVCCLAMKKYDRLVNDKEWIKHFCVNGWWGKTPYDYKSKVKKIEMLQLRLDKLKLILSTYEKEQKRKKESN